MIERTYRTIHIFVFVLLSMLILMQQVDAVQYVRPRIAVIPFDSRVNPSYGLEGALCEELSTQLVKCGRFDVLERRMLDKMMREHKIEASGIVDPETAVKIAKIAGCQLIACGTLMDAASDSSGARASVNYKVIDAETLQVWKQSTVSGAVDPSTKSDSASLIRQAALMTSSKFVMLLHPKLNGKIVSIEDCKIIINLGSSQGITSETQFILIDKGEPVVDPETHQVIGYKGGRVIIARPVAGRIQPGMCYAELGEWEEVTDVGRSLGSSGGTGKVVLSEWKWKPLEGQLPEFVRIGCEVTAGPPDH